MPGARRVLQRVQPPAGVVRVVEVVVRAVDRGAVPGEAARAVVGIGVIVTLRAVDGVDPAFAVGRGVVGPGGHAPGPVDVVAFGHAPEQVVLERDGLALGVGLLDELPEYVVLVVDEPGWILCPPRR